MSTTLAPIPTHLPHCTLRPWREGVLRHSVTKDGALIDSVMYACTAA